MCCNNNNNNKSTHPHAAAGVALRCAHSVGSRCKRELHNPLTRECERKHRHSGSRSASALRAAPPIPPNTRLIRHTAAGQAGALPLWHGCAVACGLCAARLACHWHGTAHCALPARVAVGARGRPTHTQRSCGLAINTHESRSNLSPSARQWRRNPPCTISPPRRRPRPACTPTRCRSRARRACRCASAAAPCTHRP